MKIGGSEYEWAHSRHEDEGWHAEATRDAAIAEGEGEAQDMGDSSFYLAPCVEPVLMAISGAHLAEALHDRNECEMPEDCEWLENVPDEHLDEIEAEVHAVMLAWLERHGLKPNWYGLGKIEEIEVTLR